MNPGNPILNFVPIAVIFVIFYFFVIRPQQQEMKDHKKMLEQLKKGDRVITSGGLYGTIVGFRGADLELQIAKDVKVLVARSAISKLANETNSPATVGAAA